MLQSRCEFDAENEIFTWRLTGQATLDSLKTVYLERIAHKDFRAGLNSMTVLENFRVGDMSPDQVDGFMSFIREEHARRGIGPSRRACLVCVDEMSFAILAYWEERTVAGLFGRERIFRSEAAARAWFTSDEA